MREVVYIGELDMSSTTLFLNPSLYQYMCDVSLQEPELMARLRLETSALELAKMQITPEQGQFMTLMTKLIGARNAIEVGTFTGYSAIAVARGLPAGGRLVACDVSEEWTAVGRRYWQEAGLNDVIDLRLGPALSTLDSLLEREGEGGFDLAFIDADKCNYMNYYERCLQLLRPGGLLMIDNVFWGGGVIDSTDQTPDTRVIRELNKAMHADSRVEISLVPIGDGVTLVRKL